MGSVRGASAFMRDRVWAGVGAAAAGCKVRGACSHSVPPNGAYSCPVESRVTLRFCSAMTSATLATMPGWSAIESLRHARKMSGPVPLCRAACTATWCSGRACCRALESLAPSAWSIDTSRAVVKMPRSSLCWDSSMLPPAVTITFEMSATSPWRSGPAAVTTKGLPRALAMSCLIPRTATRAARGKRRDTRRESIIRRPGRGERAETVSGSAEEGGRGEGREARGGRARGRGPGSRGPAARGRALKSFPGRAATVLFEAF